MSIKGLLFVAHGSRREKSNLEFETMVSQLQKRLDDTYAEIKAAFLEFATPSLDESLKLMMDKGVTAIQIYPFFLNSGRHVYHDIPKKISEVKEAHPNVDFILLPHFGNSDYILSLIIHDLKKF